MLRKSGEIVQGVSIGEVRNRIYGWILWKSVPFRVALLIRMCYNSISIAIELLKLVTMQTSISRRIISCLSCREDDPKHNMLLLIMTSFATFGKYSFQCPNYLYKCLFEVSIELAISC